MTKETFQPKDTGKLTNFHYGSAEDKRKEEAITSKGDQHLSEVLEKK
jgi:hypothetical protein